MEAGGESGWRHSRAVKGKVFLTPPHTHTHTLGGILGFCPYIRPSPATMAGHDVGSGPHFGKGVRTGPVRRITTLRFNTPAK